MSSMQASVSKRPAWDYDGKTEEEQSLVQEEESLYPASTHRQSSSENRSHRRKTFSCFAVLVIISVLAAILVFSAPQALLDLKGGRGIPFTQAKQKVECKRAVVIQWSTFWYGLGAFTQIMLQVAHWGRLHDRPVLFDRSANGYGTYLDHFLPAEYDCVVPERLRDLSRCWDGRAKCEALGKSMKPGANLDEFEMLWFNLDQIWDVNWHSTKSWFNASDLVQLPPLDSQHPFPAAEVVPKLFTKAYDDMAAMSYKHFTPNAYIDANLATIKYKLDMPPVRIKGPDEPPLIGLHYRGGDKLRDECKPSARMSCGNITLHSETAWEAAERYQPFEGKPKLLLMTAEPDALEMFRSDAIGKQFDIIELPHEAKGKYDQGAFNNRPLKERLEETRNMLAEQELMAHSVDTFVGSFNSNLARNVMLRGGAKRVADRRVRSVDIYYFPGLLKPIYPECDGTIRCDFIS